MGLSKKNVFAYKEILTIVCQWWYIRLVGHNITKTPHSI